MKTNGFKHTAYQERAAHHSLPPQVTAGFFGEKKPQTCL